MKDCGSDAEGESGAEVRVRAETAVPVCMSPQSKCPLHLALFESFPGTWGGGGEFEYIDLLWTSVWNPSSLEKVYLGVCVLDLPVSSVKPREPEHFQEEFQGKAMCWFQTRFLFCFWFSKKLKYCWLTVLCQSLQYSAVSQFYIHVLIFYVYVLIYTHMYNTYILFFFFNFPILY